MPRKIGLIGIGLVGTALAHNLIDAQYEVYGYDINPERMTVFRQMGGLCQENPRDVAKHCEIILLSLMNTNIVKDVLLGTHGILEANPLPKYIIDTTTGHPEKSIKLGKRLKQQDIAYLDSTISGSSAEIRQKEGIFLVGGEMEAFTRCKRIYDILAHKTLYVGEMGSGMKAKLAVNLVMGLNRVVLAEGLLFAKHLDLDLEKILTIFEETYAYSKVMDLKGKKMIENDYSTKGKLNQHKKDVSMMLDLAKREKISLPLSALHFKILEQGNNMGHGESDNSAVFEVYKEIYGQHTNQDAAIKHFAQNILGCGCPKEVFDYIDVQEAETISSPEGAIQISAKINIGRKLLIYLVSGDQFQEITHPLKKTLILLGKRQRDQEGLNRFRLVLYFQNVDGLSQESKAFLEDKSAPYFDSKIHLHLVEIEQLDRLTFVG